MKKLLLHFAAFLIVFSACQKTSSVVIEPSGFEYDQETAKADLADLNSSLRLPATAFNYFRPVPKYLAALGLQNVVIDSRKAQIGRVLFYDKNLSKDRSVSCASCHKQSAAFSDDVAFSTGVEGKKTLRNSPPLANAHSFGGYYASPHFRLFWDNRARTVGEQSLETIQNPLEMGLPESEIAARMREQPYFRALWRLTMGDLRDFDNQDIMDCLSEFVASMGSSKSPLDVNMDGLPGLDFNQGSVTTLVVNAYYNDTTSTTTNLIPGETANQRRGRLLFVKHCTSCHSPLVTLQDIAEANNGLDLNYADKGLFNHSKNTADIGVFKSPPLKNIALTGPYMHDGRFKTLLEVIDFYDHDVKAHPNLHEKLKAADGRPKKLGLTTFEKAQLIAFLESLTDTSVATDERFSDPFKH